MKISVIDKIEQYEQLKPNWDEVYSADPNTTVFVSWGWMRGWIDTKSCDWSVLAAQPDDASPYVAFMPLGMSANKGTAFRSLFLGGAGHPGSDNTGFVCLPEYAEIALPAFASFIQENIKWDRLDLRSVFDPRLDIFLRCFLQRNFYLQEDKINSCPHIMLPDSWDQYLKESLGKRVCENLKYYTRKIEKIQDFRISHVQTDNLETQIETMLMLLQTRFVQMSEEILNRYRAIFGRCFENNCLLLTISWDGTTPIAGEAAFLDQKKKIITSFKKAFNDKYAGFSPGNVMTGYIIRYAIENGFRIYDFGEGAENYKSLFGTTERYNRNVSISPKTLLGSLKKRIPVKVKELMRDAYNKNIKRYLAQS